ncbi:MAG TPA: TIGR03667 family PPOX class F420-dependent oxidoreductase [Thermomicrobiales bacterium]
MLKIDTGTPYGARVEHRLRNEQVGWLVTVDPNGTPQPSPIWFLWDGHEILIYSRPRTPKIANIERSPRVALHLNSNAEGNDIVIVTGTARIDPAAPAATDVPAYVEKYRAGMKMIGMTPETFAAAFSVPIFITPEKLRGH